MSGLAVVLLVLGIIVAGIVVLVMIMVLVMIVVLVMLAIKKGQLPPPASSPVPGAPHAQRQPTPMPTRPPVSSAQQPRGEQGLGWKLIAGFALLFLILLTLTGLLLPPPAPDNTSLFLIGWVSLALILTGILAFAFVGIFIVRIPPYFYGIPFTFDRPRLREVVMQRRKWNKTDRRFELDPTGPVVTRILYEFWAPGWHFRIPGLLRVETYEWKKKTSFFSVEVTTKDGVSLKVPGSLQWELDPELLGSEFARFDEVTIEKNLIDATTDEIEAIAGTQEYQDFYARRKELSLLINSIMRLGTPWHVEKNVPPDRRLDEYKKHADVIEETLNFEMYELDDHSPLEERFSIDIRLAAIADIAYTEEFAEAMVAAKKAALRAEAGKVRGKQLAEIANQIKSDFPGLSDRERMLVTRIALFQPGETVEDIFTVNLEGSVPGDVAGPLYAFAALLGRGPRGPRKGGKPKSSSEGE